MKACIKYTPNGKECSIAANEKGLAFVGELVFRMPITKAKLLIKSFKLLQMQNRITSVETAAESSTNADLNSSSPNNAKPNVGGLCQSAPKKLIRKFITEKLKEGEWETITDQDELNKLYAIKVREELAEIQQSKHKDIMEFVDLIQVAFSFAKQNGFTHEELGVALIEKCCEKGCFGRLALNNLNPSNPSNALYFQNEGSL